MSKLAEARAFLERETFQERWHYPSVMRELDRLAGALGQAPAERHEEMLARFHDLAGRLPYAGDSDFGALALEAAADVISAKDEVLAQRLYREADYRAGWCVQAATAGGEATARLPDMRRIEGKLKV